MKSGDPLYKHLEAMRTLGAHARRKIAYQREKAYIEYEDIYALVHEILSELLGTHAHLTEEELSAKLEHFTHEFITMPRELVREWQSVLSELSRIQYSGENPSQGGLHVLLTSVADAVEHSVSVMNTPIDDFTKHVQTIKIFLQHGDIARAEDRYILLHKEYEALSNEGKLQHYGRLQGIYNTILAARNGPPVIHQ